ncbi:DUF397 domain-containing protein [Actinomadura barringtoniae]|uniref:DUF397 domain-containing protein n=1 Tax=Actinomadura barringtoniae TaxID=1427535 RepID=A0A939PEL8_9ACTN|nr:DUF397 domain-containing protein [Actinomadura barringtoniae]MBO2448713.1 DUF397 domain-containing protein [Actinomadura barringtoniae]
MDVSTTVWRKASRSNDTGGACVELASLGKAVAVRDSKDPEGPYLAFERSDFGALVHRLKNL